VRSSGGNCLGLAALSVVVSIGQAAHDGAVIVTVPLHQTELRPSHPPAVAVSADGRFVAFVSAIPLLPADTNDRDDVYVLDRESGAVTLETSGEVFAVGSTPAISGTGRFVVYETGSQVLMVRDRASGVVRPLQRGREPPNGASRAASISGDGRYVAFTSAATNLTDGPDPNGLIEDVYVADTASMTFCRVGTGVSDSLRTSSSSFTPSLSENGRFVAFSSTVPLDPAGRSKTRLINTYLHDLQTGVTTRVSVSASGGAPDGSSYSAATSGDGRYVAFVSEATNLVKRRDRNTLADVYVRDTVANVTELVSATPSGYAGNGPSVHPALSGDGRFVVFQSEASNLICGERCPPAERDINLVADIFRRDRRTGVTEMISRGRALWMEPSIGPAADRTGSVVAFLSRHPLDQADDRHDYDLFVWSRAVR